MSILAGLVLGALFAIPTMMFSPMFVPEEYRIMVIGAAIVIGFIVGYIKHSSSVKGNYSDIVKERNPFKGLVFKLNVSHSEDKVIDKAFVRKPEIKELRKEFLNKKDSNKIERMWKDKKI